MGNANKQSKFEDSDTEEIYQIYSISFKRTQLFSCFLFALFLYSVIQIGIHLFWWMNLQLGNCVNYSGYVAYFSIVLFLSIAGIILYAIFLIFPDRFITRSAFFPHLAVWIWSGTIILSIVLRMDESLPLRVGLGWVILEIFLILVTLPVRKQVAIAYALFLGVLHTAAVLWKGKSQQFIREQLATNLLLIFGTNFIGLMGFNMNERKQRVAFQDSCQSLEVKDVMHIYSEEQQRLLLSVLPKHLADTMTQDSENSEGGTDGFKKIYMQRHEPVSILFADIVGFTAMSAALGSASKLVEILDELFSMFDQLAEQHCQVRIKILGDCYYCICGAPEERPDHAILCVHMGLAVVEAIKYFQKRTNTAVDMRVGIHTGAVLAGILGQRQWQFDVYSKDVDLANLMESGGIPGKVHVSDKTLTFLNGEFEVEPGFGETREEGLRMAGIKTYFITKVLKPFKHEPSETTNSNTYSTNENKRSNERPTYNQRLELELLESEKNSKREMSKRANKLTLRFQDSNQELEFSTRTEAGSDGILGFIAFTLSIAIITGTSFLAISFQIIGLWVGMVGLSFLSLMVIGFRKTPGFLDQKSYSKPILANRFVKRSLDCLAVVIFTAINLTLMIPCFRAGNKFGNSWNKTISAYDFKIDKWSKFECNYPSYLIIYCGFFLLSITLFSNFNFWIVSILSLIVLSTHAVILNLTSIKDAIRCSELFSFKNANINNTEDLIPETIFWTFFAVMLFLILCGFARRLELSDRIRYICKSSLTHQKECATEFRLKNENLMCNIMPQHVAKHFLNPENKSKGLYSENYLEAGVIFAAMPNFRDFYTEDAVNNQGLECLRFLNEVISDYDALLDLPKYNEQIIKIKTIGSTYMAASGLNPQKQSNPKGTLKERWRHLALLVEFALDMKKVLNQINEQSYNQFVLKVGINHGEITAGVIGNTKPAYDIWGNTANVSSRMYSTGKADKVQVTDETYRILRLYGYQFERRGYISVKGKGDILTYFLIGTGPEPTEEQLLNID